MGRSATYREFVQWKLCALFILQERMHPDKIKWSSNLHAPQLYWEGLTNERFISIEN